MWFDLDDEGSIVFTTGAETLKGRSIRRDPRVCLCIDDERPPFSFVVVEGEVDISEEPVEMLVWATRIGGPYMGGANAEAYGRRNAVPGELLVRLRPSHVVAQAAHRRVTVASRRAGSTGPPGTPPLRRWVRS